MCISISYKHTCISTSRICVYIYMCIYMYMNMNMKMHVYIHIYIYIYIYNFNTCIGLHTHTLSLTLYTYICICIYTYTYIYTRIPYQNSCKMGESEDGCCPQPSELGPRRDPEPGSPVREGLQADVCMDRLCKYGISYSGVWNSMVFL